MSVNIQEGERDDTYRGRQAEDRLLCHQALCKLDVILELGEVFHINPHLYRGRRIAFVLVSI